MQNQTPSVKDTISKPVWNFEDYCIKYKAFNMDNPTKAVLWSWGWDIIWPEEATDPQ